MIIKKLYKLNVVSLAALPIILLLCFAIVQILLRFWLMIPDSGTLGAGIVDADRMARGLKVYEEPISGHTAWIYGPLTLGVAAGVFKILGPSTLVFRLISFSGTIATVWLGASISWKGLTPFWRMLAIATFFIIDCRVAAIGSMSTDALATALAVWGVALCSRERWRYVIIGSLLILLGGATKQTALGFSIVPFIAMIIKTQVPRWQDAMMYVFPLIMAFIALVALYFISPIMWRYLIVLPRSYHISLNTAFGAIMTLVGGATPLILLLGFTMSRRVYTTIIEDCEALHRLQWLVATAMCAVLLSALSFAKGGGSVNSLMPAYFVLVSLAWALFGAARVLSMGYPDSRLMQAATLLSFAIMLSPVGSSLKPSTMWLSSQRSEYLAAIEAARSLPGRVIAPRDPSIMLFARGQHDRGYYPDMDVFGWPAAIPEPVRSRDYTADYIIEAPAMSTEPDALLLAQRGYHRVRQGAGYSIWKAPAGHLSR